MDTDVLVVGAGPTGLMLANQLVRRGVRVLIIDRHAGPSLQTRALGVQARTLEIYAKLGIVDRALELGKRGTGANMWAQGRKMARVPLGEAGAKVTPYPYILILGQDDNETDHGRQAQRAWRRRCSGTPSWSGSTQKPDKVTATLKHAGRLEPQHHGRVGRRMRRRAQLRARAERHHLSGRALRARVLRRRYGDDRQHGARRGQRLPVAGGLPSAVSDARQGSLAHRRHPAGGACATGATSTSRT